MTGLTEKQLDLLVEVAEYCGIDLVQLMYHEGKVLEWEMDATENVSSVQEGRRALAERTEKALRAARARIRAAETP